MTTCSPPLTAFSPPVNACSPLSLFQKGDLLLKENESSLDGLTHSQAVISCACLEFLNVYLQSPVSTCSPPLTACSPPMTTCSPLSLFQKGDLLLKVNESSLDGLTHSQAVATLKATINLSSVVLVALEVILVNRFAD
jgi:hypothetical protein